MITVYCNVPIIKHIDWVLFVINCYQPQSRCFVCRLNQPLHLRACVCKIIDVKLKIWNEDVRMTSSKVKRCRSEPSISNSNSTDPNTAPSTHHSVELDTWYSSCGALNLNSPEKREKCASTSALALEAFAICQMSPPEGDSSRHSKPPVKLHFWRNEANEASTEDRRVEQNYCLENAPTNVRLSSGL